MDPGKITQRKKQTSITGVLSVNQIFSANEHIYGKIQVLILVIGNIFTEFANCMPEFSSETFDPPNAK